MEKPGLSSMTASSGERGRLARRIPRLAEYTRIPTAISNKLTSAVCRARAHGTAREARALPVHALRISEVRFIHGDGMTATHIHFEDRAANSANRAPSFVTP
jgi:hypothetical protein